MESSSITKCSTPPPKSPALRRLSQIDLSFFSPASPVRNIINSNQGRVSPAFDFFPPEKSTRKRKKKPRLTKRTKQVLSFLEPDLHVVGSLDKENATKVTPMKTKNSRNKGLKKDSTPFSARKLAVINIGRKQREEGMDNNKSKVPAEVAIPSSSSYASPYGADYERFSKSIENEGSPQDNGQVYVPVYKMMPLYRRSERMDHNIKLGLELHDYLVSQGLTPTRATRMARPYFHDDFQLCTPPKSFSPFRQSARILFGHDSIIPTPGQKTFGLQ